MQRHSVGPIQSPDSMTISIKLLSDGLGCETSKQHLFAKDIFENKQLWILDVTHTLVKHELP